MILEKDNMSFDFDIPEEYKNIILHCSGGADSSILLLTTIKFLMEKGRDDAKVSVLTCSNDFKDRWNGRKAAEVINFVLEETQYQNFDMHYTYYRDVQDVKYFIDVETSLVQDSRADLFISGITLNPLGEDIYVDDIHGNKINLTEESLDNRNGDHEVWRHVNGKNFYHPFARYDKKTVAFLYDYYNVTDTLFPMTRSCEAVPDPDKEFDPEFENTPCGECWWCLERKWAFGKF